jgi:hypothetical protein
MHISAIIRFLKEDVWRFRAKDLSATKFQMIRNLKIILLAFRGLMRTGAP